NFSSLAIDNKKHNNKTIKSRAIFQNLWLAGLAEESLSHFSHLFLIKLKKPLSNRHKRCLFF
ncbi:hypothetical protein, partial [Aerococcus urinae]